MCVFVASPTHVIKYCLPLTHVMKYTMLFSLLVCESREQNYSCQKLAFLFVEYVLLVASWTGTTIWLRDTPENSCIPLLNIS